MYSYVSIFILYTSFGIDFSLPQTLLMWEPPALGLPFYTSFGIDYVFRFSESLVA